MKLTSAQKKVVEARSTGLAFSELSDKQSRHAVDQIMFHGAAISGCPLPATDFFADIIGQELIIFINDFGYGNLTLEEIFLALRINAKGTSMSFPELNLEQVSFYGHCFNVDYIAKVLSNYGRIRTYFDRQVQNYIDGI